MASFGTTDAARAKLQGGVWERSQFALAVYRGIMDLGRALANAGVSPNALTYVSLVLACGSGVAAAQHAFFWSAFLLGLSGVFDLLDGIVARASNQVSRFGALLDSTVDRVSDGAPLLGLVVAFASQPLASALPAVAMMAGFVVPYVRARAEALGVKLPTLFMRRAERVVLLILALLLGALPVAGAVPGMLLLCVVGVTATLSTIAAGWALKAAYDELERDRRGAAKVSGRVAPTPSRP